MKIIRGIIIERSNTNDQRHDCYNVKKPNI